MPRHQCTLIHRSYMVLIFLYMKHTHTKYKTHLALAAIFFKTIYPTSPFISPSPFISATHYDIPRPASTILPKPNVDQDIRAEINASNIAKLKVKHTTPDQKIGHILLLISNTTMKEKRGLDHIEKVGIQKNNRTL